MSLGLGKLGNLSPPAILYDAQSNIKHPLRVPPTYTNEELFREIIDMYQRYMLGPPLHVERNFAIVAQTTQSARIALDIAEGIYRYGYDRTANSQAHRYSIAQQAAQRATALQNALFARQRTWSNPFSGPGKTTVSASEIARQSSCVEKKEDKVTLGEIEAHRAWFVPARVVEERYNINYDSIEQVLEFTDPPRLHSTSQNYAWPIDVPAEGNIEVKEVEAGIHAYKNMSYLINNIPHTYSSQYCRNAFLVYGRVKLWGIVMEHQMGYRAQYARVSAIDVILPWDAELLAELKREYRLEDSNEQT